MKRQIFADVWDALEDDPAERARLRMRAELLQALERRVLGWKVTKGAVSRAYKARDRREERLGEAARRLGITQPRLNDLLKGRFNKFSLGALFDLAMRAGLDVKLTIDGKTRTSGRKAA